MSRNTRHCLAALCHLVALGLLLTVSAHPQSGEAAITGAVQDMQGRGIPEAVVRVRQQETSLVRSTQTGMAGAYSIAGLPIGTYTVEISHGGFYAAVSNEIRLFVGQTRTLNAELKVAGRAEQVLVESHLSEIDQTSATVGGRFERAQIANLPVNGRNWASLLPLAPGAVDPGTSDQRSVRFAGHGRDDNNITFDGVDATGISNQPQKSGIRIAIPTSTIAEFKVDSALFTADSADGTGAQMVLASIGGTNRLHGELFDYLRNDIFDARNPISQSKQPFRLNQFGATLGGPVVHDRTFFYVAFEGLRQRLDQTLQGFVPSALFRAQAIAATPAIAPLLNAYPTTGAQPQPNDPTTDRFIGLSPQISDETSGMIRLDHRFTSRLSAFLRVNVDEAISDNPLSNLKDRQITDTRPINGVFSIAQVLSPSLLNETKFGFNQVFSRTVNQAALPYSLKVSGFTTLSSARTREEDDSSAEIVDNVSVTSGRHTVKAGVEVRRVLMNPGNSADGTLAYATRSALLLNNLDSASVTAALPLKRLRKTQVFGFLQDEYKATPSLTFNIGIRYQFFNAFHEADGHAVPFDFATCGGFCAPGAAFSYPRKNDIDPRFALAWAPAALHGRTVIRSGFGIYHGDGQLEDQNLPASNDVPRYSLTSSQIAGLTYPIDSFLATAPGILSPRAQNRNRKDEYSSQWGLSIQQELPLHITGAVSYMGNKGTNLQTITTANVPDPATGAVPNPQFGRVEYRTNDSNSTFHALQLSSQRTLRAGWLLSGNYMWSHAINDGSLGGGETDAITPQNVFCRACERASSAQDIRHFFTANTVYELPAGAGKRYLSQPGFLRAALGGWSLSGILTARSGRPVNVTISRAGSSVPGGYNMTQRPDVVPGVPLTPPGGQTVNSWINPAAFRTPAPGTWGNAGRNLARGPALAQLDMGLSKRFTIAERGAIEFRTEVFNLFNRAQYGDPTGDITVPAQFGIIQSTINTTPVGTGTPRQFQFMIRAVF